MGECALAGDRTLHLAFKVDMTLDRFRWTLIVINSTASVDLHVTPGTTAAGRVRSYVKSTDPIHSA
jgi:hypothetical protein